VGVHQPDLPGLLDDVLGPGAVLVVVPGDLADVLVGEVVRELAKVLLLVGEGQINHGFVLLRLAGEGLLSAARAWTASRRNRLTGQSANSREGYRIVAAATPF
jgi:hypothetical protein